MDQEPLSRSDFKALTGQKNNRDININHIILWFLNFKCSPDEITTKLALSPTSIGIKGQEKSQDSSQSIKKVHRFSYWEYEWKIESNDFVGDLADKFIEEIIKPRIKEIKMLSEEIDAEFKIVQYYYSGHNPGYHFSIDNMKVFIEANLEVDIDTYCLRE